MTTMKLAFEQFGEPTNQPLLLLHGFFASSRNWRQIAKKLSESFHVYVLDLRNHGASPHDPVMDYGVMANDLELFITEQQLSSVHMLGHSMGGKVAMCFALNNPERIKKLVVADISPVTYQHNFNDTINALKALPLSEIANRKQADEWLSKSISELSYRQFLLQNLQLINGQFSWRIDLDIFSRCADNIIAFPPVKTVSKLGNKTLFIMGGDSNYLDQEAIDHYFPDAEVFCLEGAHHWLHVEKPDAFCNKVNDFLFS